MNKSKELEMLISSWDTASFKKDFFEKKPLLISRNDNGYFRDLLSIDTVNSYLERKDIRYPAIRLVKDGKELPQNRYLRNLAFSNQVFDRVIDNDRLFTAFSEGSTIVFQALQRTLSSLSHLCQQLENYFNFPLQTNVYLTPGSSQGFAPHYDTHDVFVLQTFGSKMWKVYDSPVVLPIESFDSRKWIPTRPQIEVELKEGDTLYIPRGFVHEAMTTHQTSMHITLGLLSYTWIDAFQWLLKESKSTAEFRKSFNWKELSSGEMKDNLQRLINQLSDHINPEAIKEEFADRLSKKALSSDKNRLMDLILQEDIGLQTEFAVRDDIRFVMEEEADYFLLKFYNKEIRFPHYVRHIFQSMLDKNVFNITDLSEEMDDAGKLVLCKKLLSEGLLTLKDHA